MANRSTPPRAEGARDPEAAPVGSDTGVKLEDAEKVVEVVEVAKSEDRAREDRVEQVAPGLSSPDDERRVSVKTTGDFMLIDPSTGDIVEPGDEPSTPRHTAWIQTRIDSGDLEEA